MAAVGVGGQDHRGRGREGPSRLGMTSVGERVGRATAPGNLPGWESQSAISKRVRASPSGASSAELYNTTCGPHGVFESACTQVRACVLV